MIKLKDLLNVTKETVWVHKYTYMKGVRTFVCDKANEESVKECEDAEIDQIDIVEKHGFNSLHVWLRDTGVNREDAKAMARGKIALGEAYSTARGNGTRYRLLLGQRSPHAYEAALMRKYADNGFRDGELVVMSRDGERKTTILREMETINIALKEEKE